MWARLAQGQKKPACFRLAETSCHSLRFPESAGMNRERDSHGLGCSATHPLPQPCPSRAPALLHKGLFSTHQAFPGEGVGVVLCRIVRGGGGGQAAGAGCSRSRVHPQQLEAFAGLVQRTELLRWFMARARVGM